jgi:hypothetical protein
VLPPLAALTLLPVAAKLRWRRRQVAQAVLTTVVTAGLLEIAVFLFEFALHHCAE